MKMEQPTGRTLVRIRTNAFDMHSTVPRKQQPLLWSPMSHSGVLSILVTSYSYSVHDKLTHSIPPTLLKTGANGSSIRVGQEPPGTRVKAHSVPCSPSQRPGPPSSLEDHVLGCFSSSQRGDIQCPEKPAALRF